MMEAARLAGDDAARFEKAVTDGGVGALQVRTLLEVEGVWALLLRNTSADSKGTWLAFREFCRKESVAGPVSPSAQVPSASPSVSRLYEAVQRVALPSAEELEGGGKAVHVDEVLMKTLFKVESNKFFVRAAYPELYKLLPFGKMGNAAIVGTPGIGKSVSSLYVLIRRVQEGHPTCFHRLSEGTTWLFADGTCVKLSVGVSVAGRFEEDPNFVVLLDRAKGNPTNVPSTAGLGIIFSSPQYENYSEWLKENSQGRFFMPPFGLNELLRFREQVRPEVDEAHVRGLFDEYGGVVRFIFGTEREKAQYMALVASELLNKELIVDIARFVPGGPLNDKGDYSHKVVFYDVDETFSLVRLRFASLNMAKRYFAAQEFGKAAEIFLGLTAGNGAKYEKMALRVLPLGRKLVVRTLGSPEESAFRVEEFVAQVSAEEAEFVSEDQIDEVLGSVPGRLELWRPKSKTYPFDGFLWNGKRWYCLQVTIDATKELKANLLRRFFERHPKLAKEVHVVMPTDVERKVKGLFKYIDSAAPIPQVEQKGPNPKSAVVDSATKEVPAAAVKQKGRKRMTADMEWAIESVSQFAVLLPRLDDSLAGYDGDMNEQLAKLKMALYHPQTGRN
jgi:hypothetical protein